MKCEVRFIVDIKGSTPERIAITARDVMLDPNAQINLDLHPLEYCQPADDYFPAEDHGWHACFAQDAGGIKLTHCFEWATENGDMGMAEIRLNKKENDALLVTLSHLLAYWQQQGEYVTPMQSPNTPDQIEIIRKIRDRLESL